MTQEEKQLLLVDLCARLPYGVKAQYYGSEEEMLTVDTIEAIYTQPFVEIVIGQYGLEIKDIKPYLRPMSSMTEEEKEEYKRTFEPFYDVDEYGKFFKCDYGEHTIDTFDWLHANHFDYRGLIQKGLAISTEEFNPYNN